MESDRATCATYNVYKVSAGLPKGWGGELGWDTRVKSCSFGANYTYSFDSRRTNMLFFDAGYESGRRSRNIANFAWLAEYRPVGDEIGSKAAYCSVGGKIQ